jgi:hypothetical protein
VVRIVLREFGTVEDRFAQAVLVIFKNFYNRIAVGAVELIDLYLFEKTSSMNAFLDQEKRNLGIATSPFETRFLAVHDAWHGTPRIMVACDKVFCLPKLVRLGCMHHEAAHTVLHGSLEYYMFSAPTFSAPLKEKIAVLRPVLGDILYLVSTAVKDYEATRLLVNNGFIKDQVAYNKYTLKPSEEDTDTWNLARQNTIAQVLFLIALLKTACCAAPFLQDQKYGGQINELLVRNINYLPPIWISRLLTLLETTSKFGPDTHQNVELFTRTVLDALITQSTLVRKSVGSK